MRESAPESYDQVIILEETLAPSPWERAKETFTTPWVVAFLVILLLSLLIWWAWHQPPLRPVTGLPEPVQETLPYFVDLPAPDEFTITGTHKYRIEAAILSRATYSFGKESRISPVDFALGWGPVAEEPNITAIQWSQSGRWYRYRWDYSKVTLSEREIGRNSANVHIIPDWGNDDLRSRILSFQRGDVVRMEGYLVTVRTTGSDWSWRSSITRNDTGNGACEIFYVLSAEKVSP